MIRARTFPMLASAVTFAAAVLLAGAPAAADPGKGAAKGAEQGSGSDVLGRVFSEIEKHLIREYYGQHDATPGKSNGKGNSRKMPPGLAKREHLPPGLERQLEKNGTLPPGLAKRDLPPDLVSRLPRRPPGIERKIVGTDVVLVEQATGVILDILRGVATNKK
jgi:hypothetical protein